MEIRRTANAGVLLIMDGVEILLDGVCREVSPYLGTPRAEWDRLTEHWPDAVCFTHTHEDHFHSDYADAYRAATGREILTAEGTAGDVRIFVIPTRHLGKAGTDTDHCSFVIQGSKTVWFLGDASPSQLKQLALLPNPDAMVVPFAFLASQSAVQMLKAYLPCAIVLVHMPHSDNDPEKIWNAVAPGMEALKEFIHAPNLGETITL